MNYDKFIKHLGRVRLSIKDFAELVRMRPNSITNYAKQGRVPAHLAIIAVLISALEERKIDTKKLLSDLQTDAKKPRGAGLGKFGGNEGVIPFQPEKPPQQSSPSADTGSVRGDL